MEEILGADVARKAVSDAMVIARDAMSGNSMVSFDTQACHVRDTAQPFCWQTILTSWMPDRLRGLTLFPAAENVQ